MGIYMIQFDISNSLLLHFIDHPLFFQIKIVLPKICYQEP